MTNTRREFLKATAVLGAGVATVGLTPILARADGRMTTRTAALMGTFVTIAAVHESKTLAAEAIGGAFDEIRRLTSILSRHDADTPMSVLNRDGRLSGAPAELTALVNRAGRYHSLSNGAFDATVAPVVDLLKAKADRLTKQELAEALELVDGSQLVASGDTVGFGRSGMQASLDGIAKGYIVDRAAEMLAAKGVTSHMINAGGDIRTSGSKNGKAWRIAVEDPAKKGRYPAVVAMRSGAIATSGSYERYYTSDKHLHHLVNPATGLSPLQAVSVTIKAPTVMEADALSTTVFVLGPQKGVAFIDSLPHRECLILTQNGAEVRSRNWA